MSDSVSNPFKRKKPFLIAGPCSAETESQVLETARRLAVTGKVDMLRAGIWKPRTRPGSFEGIGAKGLPWMQAAKEVTGLPIITEVAKASHVELCLEFDFDALWIGARTTVNPFAVQEIADALKGIDIPVLLKNPINPDLALWLGAIERLASSDIEKLGVIHRGFSTYEKTRYRNNPEWQLPIDLQNRFPDLPLILDPSHIAGRRDIIFDLSQTALDLNYDGLMVETHHDPDNAWSDAAQQITPSTLIEFMEDLKIRKETDEAADYKNKINTLRTQIDVIDHQLIEMLGKRMTVADAIGALKKEHNVAVLQTKRWNEILGKMILQGEEKNLSEEFILRVFKAVHQESINHQEKIINH